MRNPLMQLLFGVALVACQPPDAGPKTPVETDTDTGEPKILPIDTAVFIPEDTGPETVPNLTPSNYVYMTQVGTWALSAASPPYSDMSGTLRIVEYIDTLDTALPVYECNVAYALTGSARDNHTCADCDFVFDVEFYVNSGDPGGCHDPDAPQSGVVWELGFDEGTEKIYLNYYGTDVWLPWYDATKLGSDVTFDWAATLAIEVPDTGDTQ